MYTNLKNSTLKTFTHDFTIKLNKCHLFQEVGPDKVSCVPLALLYEQEYKGTGTITLTS